MSALILLASPQFSVLASESVNISHFLCSSVSFTNQDLLLCKYCKLWSDDPSLRWGFPITMSLCNQSKTSYEFLFTLSFSSFVDNFLLQISDPLKFSVCCMVYVLNLVLSKYHYTLMNIYRSKTNLSLCLRLIHGLFLFILCIQSPFLLCILKIWV